MVTAVHDVSDGGARRGRRDGARRGLGAEVLLWAPFTADAFGEDQGRYVVTIRDDEQLAALSALEDECEAAGIQCAIIGAVGGDSLKFVDVTEWENDRFDPLAEIRLADLRDAHEGFFPTLMGADAALA